MLKGRLLGEARITVDSLLNGFTFGLVDFDQGKILFRDDISNDHLLYGLSTPADVATVIKKENQASLNIVSIEDMVIDAGTLRLRVKLHSGVYETISVREALSRARELVAPWLKSRMQLMPDMDEHTRGLLNSALQLVEKGSSSSIRLKHNFETYVSHLQTRRFDLEAFYELVEQLNELLLVLINFTVPAGIRQTQQGKLKLFNTPDSLRNFFVIASKMIICHHAHKEKSAGKPPVIVALHPMVGAIWFCYTVTVLLLPVYLSLKNKEPCDAAEKDHKKRIIAYKWTWSMTPLSYTPKKTEAPLTLEVWESGVSRRLPENLTTSGSR